MGSLEKVVSSSSSLNSGLSSLSPNPPAPFLWSRNVEFWTEVIQILVGLRARKDEGMVEILQDP
jgi:hypothetical protein